MEVITHKEYTEKAIPIHHQIEIDPVVQMFDANSNEELQVDLPEDKWEYLEHLNVLLTNGCNLQCDYCFEQHKKDYGKWTIENLNKAYQFLARSKAYSKTFQFFGGEPLLKSRLMFDFLDTLENPDPSVKVKIVTNGLLLDNKFLMKYLSYDNTHILVSLDTLRAEIDHRQLTEDNIIHIVESISKICSLSDDKSNPRVSIRTTISPETAPYLGEFIQILYGVGVRSFTVHPLTMSLTDGFIEWDEIVWNKMYHDMLTAINVLPDLHIEFSEGVGYRKDNYNNCLVGNGMLAIDSSGDISGCYFLNNLKEDLGSLILGNIFTNKFYKARYDQFHMDYNDLFLHDECKECEAHGLCYQCPVGNFATSGKLFQPDAMCKKIVSFHQMIRKAMTQIDAMNVKKEISAFIKENGVEYSRLKVLTNLASYIYTNKVLTNEEWQTIETNVQLDAVLSLLVTRVDDFYNQDNDRKLEVMETSDFLNKVVDKNKLSPLSIDDTYNHIYQSCLGAMDYSFSGFEDLSEIDKITLIQIVCLQKRR